MRLDYERHVSMEEKVLKLIAAGIAIVVIGVVSTVWLLGSILKPKSNDDEESKVNISNPTDSIQVVKHDEATTYVTQNGTVTIEENLYDVTPGYTFYVNKGAMELYADIIPTVDGNLMVIGKEFHNGNEMPDAAIKELFFLSDGVFMNTNKDITIKYEGFTAEFTDLRTDALRFTGELSLLKAPANLNIDYSNIVSADIATPIDSDTISEDEITTGESDQFVASNEQKTISVKAKFIESTSNSGTLYEEVGSGVRFYAFGKKYPYAKDEYASVTVTGTYRGDNKRFNGLQMDDVYPCMVIKSIEVEE